MNAKERLSEYEWRLCYFLKEMGVGKVSVLLDENLDIHDLLSLADFLKETVPILEYYGFISFKKAVPFVDGYAEDIFFKSYLKLLKEGKFDEADQLSELCDFKEIKVFREGKITKENIDLIWDKVLDKPFGADFCSCIALEIEISQEFIDFVKNEIEKEFDDENEESPQKTETLVFKLNEEPPKIIVRGAVCSIRKYTRQYDFLNVISSDPKKDWQFSEIGEKLDFAKKDEWKKLHNVALALKAKIAVSGQKDFFITTTQSVKINPSIFEQKKENLDDFFKS